MNIVLNILSKFKKDGTDQASKEVDKLSQSQGNVASKSKQAAQASVQASAGFGAAGASASAAAGGGIGPLSSALGQLLQMMPKLARYAGPAGLIIAGAVAWYKAIKSVYDAKKKLKEQIDGIKFGNIEASIKSTTEQYALQRKEIDRNYQTAKRLHDFQQSRDDALTAQKLAELELETERVKAEDPENEFHVRRTENAAAKARADILAEAEDRRFKQQRASRELDRKHYSGVSADASSKIADYESDLRRIEADEENARKKAKEEKEQYKAIGQFMPGIIDKIDKKLSERLDKLAEGRKDATDGIAAQIDVRKDADEVLRRIVHEATLAAIQKGTVNVQSQTATQKAAAAGTAIDRDQEKARDEERRKLMDDRISKLKDQASSTAENLRWKAKEFDADDFSKADYGTRQQARIKDKRLDQQAEYAKKLEQQIADADRMVDALPLEKLVQKFDQINRKLNRLETALQNLPNN